MGARRAKTIDEYLARVGDEQREVLEKLRRTIHKLAPRAEECISYGIPAFRLDGVVIGGFAATSKGCSYYPFSGSTLATLRDELAGYSKTKSALHFDTHKPLPANLVRKLLRTRLAERSQSRASLREIPEVDLTRAKVRRNPYASRIASEGMSIHIAQGRPRTGAGTRPTIPKSLRLPKSV